MFLRFPGGNEPKVIGENKSKFFYGILLPCLMYYRSISVESVDIRFSFC